MYMDSSYAAILSNLTRAKLDSYGIETKLWAYDHNTDKPEYVGHHHHHHHHHQDRH